MTDLKKIQENMQKLSRNLLMRLEKVVGVGNILVNTLTHIPQLDLWKSSKAMVLDSTSFTIALAYIYYF